MLAPLGLVMLLSFGINRLSAGTALTLFFVYAGLLGLSLASIFLVYTHESITRVFFISAATFGAMSLYGYTTQRDLTGVGSFMFMGLIGIIIASLVNMFLQSSGLGWAISVIGVLIFVGLTAYDTQNIKEMYSSMDDGTVAGRKAVMGALRLYLDFINLFLMLLRLFGDRRAKNDRITRAQRPGQNRGVCFCGLLVGPGSGQTKQRGEGCEAKPTRNDNDRSAHGSRAKDQTATAPVLARRAPVHREGRCARHSRADQRRPAERYRAQSSGGRCRRRRKP